jgi:light-regulated signal transduction histidine kinase (bacteriophytochrome)
MNTPHPAGTAGTSTEHDTQLMQVQRELDGLNYAISHDLRAPLRAIAGFNQALREQAALQSDITAQHYLQRIEQSTQRLGAMIDGLLALSRLSQADMHLVQVDLSVLCAEIFAEIAQQFPSHHPRVQVAEPIKALCDPYLMRIALRELLHNAWKFTQEQPDPQIAVEASIHQDHITVCIRDNGIGIDMRYAERLFVPFQHLQTRPELNGTGIGLAKAQRVINRHAGKVWADAAPLAGSVFCFSLRCCELASRHDIT